MEQENLTDEPEAIELTVASATRYEGRCPHIGLHDDRDTLLAFPSDGNRCYRHEKAVPLTIEWQGEYCLTEGHHACSIYLQEELPEDTSWKFPVWLKWSPPIALMGLLVLIITVAAFWWPTFGSSKQESTGNAAELQKSVLKDSEERSLARQEFVQAEKAKLVDLTAGQGEEEIGPPLSLNDVESKEGFHVITIDPAIITDAVIPQPALANVTAVPGNTLRLKVSPAKQGEQEGKGGFRVLNYE